jgi:putative FmdB family regulatory protein
MPVYEYRCAKCGMTMTIVRQMTDEEHKPGCAGCGLVMTRYYHEPAVTFKGKGWGKD